MVSNGARYFQGKRRASLLLGLSSLLAVPAWSQEVPEYRVAGVIDAGIDSKALIEGADGEQGWYKAGDNLGGFRIERIDLDGITVVDMSGKSRLLLRGDATRAQSRESLAAAVPRERSRNVQFRNVLSQINTVTPQREEPHEQATARHLNRVLGLADQAIITAIDEVEVATAAAAHAELKNRLLADRAIRISVNNAHTRILYILPDQ